MNERRKPYVFVTLEGPDDGGDFGPNTPGTKTSGLQEAIDYAHDNCRDVYIYGGRGGMHEGEGVNLNVYTLDETLKVPWSQDFRLDGGNYVLSYRKSSGDAIHIDSQMNCRYKFGLIASASDGAAVRFKPETPGPDDFVVITASVFDFSAACSRGTGILIDTSEGPIVNSKIFAEETNTLSRGVYIRDDGSGKGSFSNNWLQVMFTNQCHATEDAIGFRIGDPGSSKISHNRFFRLCMRPRVCILMKRRKSSRPQKCLNLQRVQLGRISSPKITVLNLRSMEVEHLEMTSFLKRKRETTQYLSGTYRTASRIRQRFQPIESYKMNLSVLTFPLQRYPLQEHIS